MNFEFRNTAGTVIDRYSLAKSSTSQSTTRLEIQEAPETIGIGRGRGV
jgi:hypothetical protein